MPPRTPSKKVDEESVASSKRDESSPVLKKATVATQPRSESFTSGLNTNSHRLTEASTTEGKLIPNKFYFFFFHEDEDSNEASSAEF